MPKTYLSGKDFYDALPDTGNTFHWENGVNIKVEYIFENTKLVDSSNIEITDTETVLNGSEWELTDKNPNSKVSAEKDVTDQRYMVWDENLKIEFPPQSKFYIYVTLTFAGGNGEWENYINAKGGNVLTNTLYVYKFPDRVTHSLSEPGKVLLQKGVYETGYYTRGANYITEYYRGIDRYHYTPNDPIFFKPEMTSEQKGAKNTVTYYLIIKNSGSTNLYLSDVYDILPQGFEFYALRNSATDKDGNINFDSAGNWVDTAFTVGSRRDRGINSVDINQRYIPTAPSYSNNDGMRKKMNTLVVTPSGYRTAVENNPDDWEKEAYVNGEKMKFVLTHIGYAGEETLSDGRKRIKFHFVKNGDEGFIDREGGYYDSENKEDNIGTIQIDGSSEPVPYLAPGEFTQFAYTVYTAGDNVAEEKAVNYAAMEYIDTSGNTEVDLDTETGVDVAKYNSMENNDGSRELWDNTQAQNAGFSETSPFNKAEERQWLVSGVTVEKGDIIPGITKKVTGDNDLIEKESTEKEVNWTVTSRNNGTDAMTDYVISDTLEPGFRFEGDVQYEIYGNSGPVSNEAKKDNSTLLKCGINVEAPNPNSSWAKDNGRGSDVMFHIARDTGDMNKLLISANTVHDDIGSPVTVNANYDEWTYIPNIYFYDIKNTGHENGNILAGAFVKFERKANAQGKECETLKIRFAYRVNDTTENKAAYAIPAGGYSVLKVNTVAGTEVKSGMYLNNAYIIPSQKFDESDVSQGHPIKLGDNEAAVQSTAPVTFYQGTPTSSYKEIEEIGAIPENKAASNDENNNCILVSDKSSKIRYTLNIKNSNEKDINQLVVIDNLPQKDNPVMAANGADGNTLRDELKRYSEFKVSLAPDPDFKIEIISEAGIKKELNNTDYEVQYSTKTSGFIGSDWEADKSTEDQATWKDNIGNLESEARSIRFVIGDGKVTQGDAVKISFNAVIDDAAQPSQVAWNSFGYSYLVGGLRAQAAPLNVGVRIPSSPQIKKAIVTNRGGLSPIDKDMTFKFLIYKASDDTREAIDFGNFAKYSSMTGGENYTEYGVYTEDGLADWFGRISWQVHVSEYAIFDLKVDANNSESLPLDNNILYQYGIAGGPPDTPKRSFYKTSTQWKWEDGATYYILEIDDTDPANEGLSFFGINGKTQRQYKFVYNPSKNEEITISNSKPDWNVRILKQDENANPLEGALFGIYTPNAGEKMSDEDFAALGIDKKYQTRTIPDGGGSSQPYYLMAVETSNENGVLKWSGLGENTYVVHEITPPSGYYDNNEDIVFARSAAEKYTDKTLSEIVVNKAIAPLPETGGKGVLPIMILGMVISLTALTLLYLRKLKPL